MSGLEEEIEVSLMLEWGNRCKIYKFLMVDIFENGEISAGYFRDCLAYSLDHPKIQIGQMRTILPDGQIGVDICAGVRFADKDGNEYSYEQCVGRELYYYKDTELVILPKGHTPLFFLSKPDSFLYLFHNPKYIIPLSSY